MNMNFNECKQILDTLPVGYYCGRRIPITLSADEETSFYSPIEDKICISYPIIMQGVSSLPDGADLEQAVRSMLYHETSHAILTPKRFMQWYNEEERNALNIFEDERIETILANFYMNVDFHKQLNSICKPVEIPTTALEAFFNIVRFHYGDKKFVDRAKEIIQNFSKVNSRTDYFYSYQNSVIHFYRDIAKLFSKKPASFKLPKITFDSVNCADADPSGETISSDSISEPMLSEEEIKGIISKAFSLVGDLAPNRMEQIRQFEKTIEILFANFNKRNSGGNGINTYSGVFNPRAVGRKDYKYFERAITTNGNNKFGSMHLNLFLDKSGSFESNQGLVNAILNILSKVERRNKNFSLDVYFINTRIAKVTKLKDRVMQCCGGNNIPDETAQIFIDAQKPNTYNYNIVLFDGDALSDCRESFANRAKRFHVFDRKQTYLITDSENVQYIEHVPYTKAKVIVTSDYTNELIKNILRAFQTMLA